jgi:ubiquinone biosynthesis protein Coq4
LAGLLDMGGPTSKPELKKVEEFLNFGTNANQGRGPSLASIDYAYSSRPVRNPFRYLAAVWRLIRTDPSQATADAAVVEIGFARSKWGRRFARWEQTVSVLKSDPRTSESLRTRRPSGPIDLEQLEKLPAGCLGQVFAQHCRSRGLDPNLVHVPPDDEVGWLLNHLYQTHDIWHVVTGWGNDLPGEVGLGAFYAAQLRSPTFFGFMLALIFFNVIWRRADLDEIFAAFSSGFQGGRKAEPIFGTDWSLLWELPIEQVRQRFSIDRAQIVGDGISEAA